MNFPCISCNNYNRRREVIEFDPYSGQLVFPVCELLRLIVSESELTEQEKIKLNTIKNRLKSVYKDDLPCRYFVIRNRIYTTAERNTDLRCRISAADDMEKLQKDCPFYPEMFLFLENFKKKLIFS